MSPSSPNKRSHPPCYNIISPPKLQKVTPVSTLETVKVLLEVGRTKTVVAIPRGYTIVSTYHVNQSKEELFNEKKKVSELLIHKSTLENRIDQLETEINNMKEENCILQCKLQQSTQKVESLNNNIKENRDKTVVGGIILNLPNTMKRWHPSSMGRYLYGLGWSYIPAASSRYLQMAIPIFIAAFFCDIGIGSMFDSLAFLPTITPSNKALDQCVLLLREFVLYMFAQYINNGTVISICHDKGERAGLGRLIRIFSVYNRDCRLDPNFPSGIISLILDADGVQSNDKDISVHLGNSLLQCRPYMNAGSKINISFFTTDAGGGGGTKEGCANEFNKQYSHMMHEAWYVITCMLHGHSKPLEKAWEEAFGKFGNGHKTVGQFIYQCWYIASKMGNTSFKKKWKEITTKDWVGKFLCRPVLSRWGYPLTTATIIFEYFALWQMFLQGMVLGTNKSSSIGQAVDEAIGLIKNPVIRVHVSFLVAFGKKYWTPGYNWIRRKDSITKIEAHSCHEVLLQVFCMHSTIKKLCQDWQSDSEFVQCKHLLDGLSSHVDKGGNYLSEKESTCNRIKLFFKIYNDAAFCNDSGFKRWTTILSSFMLGSTNKKAVTLFAKHLVSMKHNAAIQDTSSVPPPTRLIDNEISISTRNSIHDEFSYSDFVTFISKHCTISLDDHLIRRNWPAIELLSNDKDLYLWGDDPFQIDSSMDRLKNDIISIVLTAKHHQQPAKAGVQAISHCSQNRKSESISTAFVTIRSYFHQAVTIIQQDEVNGGRIMRGNQHRTKGSISSSKRECKSSEAIRLEEERDLSFQDTIITPQAGLHKTELLLRLINNHTVMKDEAVLDILLKNATNRKANAEHDGYMHSSFIRQTQKDEIFNAIKSANVKRRAGQSWGQYRCAELIDKVDVERPSDETQQMKVKNFSRLVQKPYLLKEIIWQTYSDTNNEKHIDGRHRLEIQLKNMNKLKDLKAELMKALNTNDSNTMFELCSPEARAVGAGTLIQLK